VREFRPRRTVAASCVAGALTAVGVLGVSELVRIQLNGADPDRAAPGDSGPLDAGPVEAGLVGVVLRGAGPDGTGFAWADPAMLVFCAGLVAVGLFLLLLALVPGVCRTLPLEADDPDCAGALSRRGLRRIVAAAANGVPGIERVRVRLRGRWRTTLLVRVGMPPAARSAESPEDPRAGTGNAASGSGYRNPGRLAEQVELAVQARLDAIGLAGPPRVLVRLRWRDV
jgi:hypothetical protein